MGKIPTLKRYFLSSANHSEFVLPHTRHSKRLLMNSERSRLRTFQNWPTNAPVDYERIAKAGFYYMGQNLEVQCFFCGGRILEWQYGDTVMAKHRLLDPRCPFVVNPTESGNIPVIGTPSEPEGGGTSRIVNELSDNSDLNESSKYKSEEKRLETFITWPIQSKIDGYRLAKAGFYYLQESDKVRCAYCRIDAYNWEAGDDPIVEHRRHSPTCPFLSNLSVGCGARGSDDVIALRQEYCNFEPEYGLDANRMKDFGILNHRIPKHSNYMTEESRIASFNKWPNANIKDPVELAKAGFYYTGIEDKVRCYHCGGGLQKWKANDEPWIEHAKWFSSCDFLFLVRGEEFVNEIRKKYLSLDDESTHDLGLHVSRIKQVLREFLMHHQKKFPSRDELIAAVLDTQFNEPVADLTRETWIRDPVSDRDQRRQSLETYRALLGQNFRSRNDDSLGLISEDEESLIEIRDFLDNRPKFQITACRASLEIPEAQGGVIICPSLDPPEEFAEVENNSEVDGESAPALQEQEEILAESMKEVISNKIITLPTKEDDVEGSNKSALTLQEENQRLKEAKLCKICMDQDANIVFLPCGHLVTCSVCAANIPDCPVCRQLIKGTVRTFLA